MTCIDTVNLPNWTEGQTDKMEKALAVYTVAMGAEFSLPATVPCSGVSYICFSDRPQVDPNGWTVQIVEPLLPLDLTRSSREQKIRPHRWLSDFDRSIYIDTKVQLTASPLDLWDYLVPTEDTIFGALHHSFRDSIEDEFALVKGKGFDNRDVLKEQLEIYRKIAPEVLTSRPVWGGMLARRHNDRDLLNAMELWFAHVLRYSRRDQLSLVLALSKLPRERISLTTCNNHESAFHVWPVGNVEKPARFFEELPATKRTAKDYVLDPLRYLRQLAQRGAK